MNGNTFICQLSEKKQMKIKKILKEHLIKEGYKKEKMKEIIENVMSSRLNILEEIIDITKI